MVDLDAEVRRLTAIRDRELEIARRRAARPLDYMEWLPGQLAFLQEESKRKLFRSGNQAQGKTTAGAAEALYRAMGHHPFKVVHPAPTFQWAICSTEQQSGIVQRKVWELAPKDLVSPRSRFDPDKGAFLGKYPALRLTNGSWIGFKTGGGDTTNLASEKLHHAWFDEPPESERVYNEVQKRLLRTNGDLSMTFTPVNRPVAYLKKLAEKKRIRDLHFDLRPEHLVFGDGRVMRLEDNTPMDKAWIEQLIAETSDMEVPVVIHGEWEFRLEGAYFTKAWNPARMVTTSPPSGDYSELLGIDFGDGPGKQVVLYILAMEREGGHPHIHVEDEYVGTTGLETNEDDARSTLRMLKRRETKWESLKAASADRAHKAGTADQKSANDLARAIAHELELEDYRDLRPAIRVAKRGEGRGSGSVRRRWRHLHAQMARGNFTVHPRCKRLIEALPKAHPLRDDEYKDPIDALAYGVDEYVFLDVGGSEPVALW